jgi:peptidylprolyl isomerase
MKNILILIACAVVLILAYSYISNGDTSAELNMNGTDAGILNGTSVVSTGAASSTLTTTSSATSTEVSSAQASSTDKTTLNSNKNKKTMNVTFKTNKGDITIELFEARVPNTVANFRKLAEAGFYDGVKFHRVIKGFMIQSGDPLSKDDSKTAFWGTGGPGYKFADEINADNRNDIGTIAMANAGPNTNGSQFFINVNPNNFLDGKHTVFGKVIKGMDVVTAIEDVDTDSSDRPLSPVSIQKVTF